MNEVIIRLSRGSNKVREYKRLLPSEWKEVHNKRLFPFLRTLLLEPEPKGLLQILRELLRLPKTVFYSMGREQLYHLLQLLEWMKPSRSVVPLVSSFRHREVRYYLPKAKFKNGSAIEYPIADDYYTKFVEQKDYKALLLLTATLCREQKKDETAILKTGDQRVVLHGRTEVEARAKRLSKLGIEYQIAVLMYFAGIKEYIHTTYAGWIFPANEAEGATEKESDNLFGWWGIYFDIAESGVFGSLEKVHQMNFHTICMYLVKKKKEYDKWQQQQNRPS